MFDITFDGSKLTNLRFSSRDILSDGPPTPKVVLRRVSRLPWTTNLTDGRNTHMVRLSLLVILMGSDIHWHLGCNELLFNPLVDWWRLGPITKQLRLFLWSDAPVHYKITMMAYMFSYYGLAGSALLSIINYFLLGFALEVDGYYMHSFEIWLACTVVFPGAGNIGYTLLEYRLGHRNIFSSFIENITWIPFL